MIQTNSLWARLITSANRLSWIDASELQSVFNVSAHRGGGGLRVADFKGIENRMNFKEGVVNPKWMGNTSTANPAYLVYQVDENAGDQLISGSLGRSKWLDVGLPHYAVVNATPSSALIEMPTFAPIGQRVMAWCPADRTSNRSGDESLHSTKRSTCPP